MPDQSADNKPKRPVSTADRRAGGDSADPGSSRNESVERGRDRSARATAGAQVANLTITESADGQRLDNFLLNRLKGAPRSLIYRIIRRGEVRVNGGRARADRRLSEGDRVRVPPVRLSGQGAAAVVSRATRSAIESPLFEDEHLLVVDKPSGLAVHGGTAVRSGIVEQLRQHRPDAAFLELAHRLDRETSGCLVLAKNRKSLLGMHEQFRQSGAAGLVKRYIALMRQAGDSQPPVDRKLIVNQPLNDSRHQDKQAVSEFWPRRHYSGATLMDVEIHTGRKHQIRRHAVVLEMPLAGDDRYGDYGFNRQMRKHRLKRLFLHAAAIRFRHPISERLIELETELPEDLNNCLDSLEER